MAPVVVALSPGDLEMRPKGWLRHRMARVSTAFSTMYVVGTKQPIQANFPHHPLDLWLSRLGLLSQVGTLTLAIIGYFYVVVPLYTKEVLEEQIAKKELDLRQKNHEISTLELNILAEQLKLAETARAAERQKAQLNQLEQDIANQTAELATNRIALAKVKDALKNVEQNLNSAKLDAKTKYEAFVTHGLTLLQYESLASCIYSVIIFQRSIFAFHISQIKFDNYLPCIRNSIMQQSAYSSLTSLDKEHLQSAIASVEQTIRPKLLSLDKKNLELTAEFNSRLQATNKKYEDAGKRVTDSAQFQKLFWERQIQLEDINKSFSDGHSKLVKEYGEMILGAIEDLGKTFVEKRRK